MAAPKIKMYLLRPGYSEAGDNDVQQQYGDELLPVVDRSQLLADAALLTGIVPHYESELVPVNLAAGRQTADLGPDGEIVQTPQGHDMTDVLIARGYLGFQVKNSLNETLIEHVDYTISPDGVQFITEDGIGPSGATASFYLKGTTPTTLWALEGSTLYDGDNDAFNKLIIRVDDGPSEAAAPADANNAHIELASPASSVKATYAYTMQRTRFFCGDHNNWVDDHLEMRPDVFVGTRDYPGDASEVNGVPYEPGPVPQYREPGSYQLNARDGLVQFSEIIDAQATPVRANYAYLVGIRNVTRMRLEAVSGTNDTHFAAQNETAFPDAHDKRWVMQKSRARPLNVYVDGEIVPKNRTVVPYDQLTVKTEA